MNSKDYPSLYRESDSVAVRSQRKHFWVVRVKIIVLLVVAGITSVAWSYEPALRTPAAIILAVLLVASIALTAIMNIRDFDRLWLCSRKIAESVKAESWRFMTRTGNYGKNLTDSEAKDRFLDVLRKIVNRHPFVCPQLTSLSQAGSQITESMKKNRKQTIKDRRDHYIQNRIHDQRIWYAKKAKWNKSQESQWFIVTWILELAAASIAIIQIILGDTIVSPFGIVTTAGAGVLSWVNARSYSEPAESYGLVAQELSLLEDRAKNISTEDGLAKIVAEVEESISKEHAIWLARLL